jgi:hypothetical protein
MSEEILKKKESAITKISQIQENAKENCNNF